MFANLRRVGLLLPAHTIRTAKPEIIRKHSTCQQTSEKALKDKKPRKYIKKGPGLEFFIHNNGPKINIEEQTLKPERIPYVNENIIDGAGRKGTASMMISYSTDSKRFL